MKKLYTTEKYKKRNKKRAKSSLKRKLEFKKYRKEKNKSEIGLSRIEKHHRRVYETPYKKYSKIKAPKILSFIKNPDGVSKFIDKIKRKYDNKDKVFVVLKDVEQITYDAIVVLLSILVKFKANNIPFNGDFPKNKDANRILEQSKFLEYLYTSFRNKERYDLGQKSSIHTHAWKDVDSELSSKLIEQASKTVWGEKRRCQGVQRTLIELMLNTNNHANSSEKGEKYWWLSISHNKKDKMVSFAFIDFGVGVFTSLNEKKEGSKFFGAIEKMKKRIKFGNNAELLKLILNGKLHQTATGKSFHGKGLPGIKKVLVRNQIKNLNIITNNVHAKVDFDDYKILPTSFSGTFVYWEINNQNLSCYV